MVGLVSGNIRPTDPLNTGFNFDGRLGYNRTREECAKARRACGFKWMLSQRLALAWDSWLLRAAVDHGIGLIFLHRENLLRRYFSAFDKGVRDRAHLDAGRQRDAPVLPDFPLPLGEALLRGLESARDDARLLDEWRAEAERRGARTLRMTYEQMTRDKPAALAEISDFILANQTRCDPGDFSWKGALAEEKHAALHGHVVLSRNVTNWPAVVAELRGTKFEQYLTMDGSTLT